MKRLFILVPDIDETAHIAHELGSIGVKENQIHVCGGTHEDLEEAHLHQAGVIYTSHLGSAIKKGPIVGFLFFLFILAIFTFVLPDTVQISAFGYIAMFIFGIVIGVWATGLIGISVKDEVVEKYEDYVKEGHFIMLVDTDEDKQREVSDKILAHHPNAKLADMGVHKEH